MSDYVSETARVYTDFGSSLPPHPGKGWTRFVCISDTHSQIVPVPEGDVLIHAGDLCSWGLFKQLKPTLKWLVSLKHPVKVAVAGNHDLCLDKQWASYGLQGLGQKVRMNPSMRQQSLIALQDIEEARAYIHGKSKKKGLHYLEHSPFSFKSPSGREWKMHGSPAAPAYVTGSFQYSTQEEAKALYDKIPDDVDILVTHTPPSNTLDRTKKGTHAGCPVLAERLNQLSSCRLHVFGHIHESHGAEVSEDGRVSVNAAMQSGGRPTVVDLKD
ncbi:Metallo-dependent phosphatase [Coniophora puteana RWD-64-598 SS2]|uniref:Metallo-dependent phosphatase n=1 Tax=Coniophora puteana (strain RWD-64-598) TaxID=741705 RepID=A0A5M3N1V6_CONPW|nr:Metallo-dependent phosphatase [Coniophora puteana RWD-64-598 SS2]EIW85373.1 Metallo-dependent phosphatase [Coniophora puteana RWD-64-598 SS2]